MQRRARHHLIQGGRVALVAAALLIVVYQARRLEAQVSQQGPVVVPSVTVTLHGSTPAMAWSPDSKRVVVNSAYEYFGHDDEIRRNAAGLGIYVIDGATKATTHVYASQGYHPFWLNSSTVGWGHSVYEDGREGIYVAQVAQNSQPQKVGSFRGVHRTLLAKGGGILAYIGFPEGLDWVVVDPSTGQSRAIAALASVSSWGAPAGHYHDQCPQKAGGTQLVSSTGPSVVGVALRSKGRTYRLSSGPLHTYSGYGGGSGVIRPCLSFNGRHVAFLTPTQGIGDFALNIARVP